jgi:ketosteroid isomerase-like protein
MEKSHDVEKVLTLLTDDIVIEDVTFGVVMKGKDRIKQTYLTLFTAAPDFKLDQKAWVTDDKSFAVEIVRATIEGKEEKRIRLVMSAR